MKKIVLLFGLVAVSVVVAVTYFAFEYIVSHSITFIWDDVFDTDTARLMVIPLCVGIGLLFYGLQHWLDRGSENHEEHSMGGAVIQPTLRNFVVILLVGFFSLIAGASLGPEAILVPAATVISMYMGVSLFKRDDAAVKALTAAGIMALMTAFFHSIPIGILSVLLVANQAKTKVTPQLLFVAVIASISSFLTLQVIDPAHRYFNFPPFSWEAALIDLSTGIPLIVAGYAATFMLKYSHATFVNFRAKVGLKNWWELGLVASLGMSALYLLGGPLVQFTGNESIAPLVSQAASLGVVGLLVVLAVKLLVIGWSKAMGYRGGLIFPMVFVASTLVAISQVILPGGHFGMGLLAAMIGVLAAEKKAKVLL